MLSPAHVLLAMTLGLSVPLFEVLGRGANFFVARQATPLEVVLVVLAWATLPTALGLLGGPRVRRLVVAAGLAAFLACALGNRNWPPGLILAVAGAGGVAATGLLVTRRGLRGPAGAAAGLAPLLVLQTLLASPIARLLGRGDAPPPPFTGDPGPPIVMLVFDEFPVSSMETASAHPLTHAATAAIGTGVLGAGLEAATWRAMPGTLFTLLAGSHRLVVHEPSTDLCPDGWVEAPPRRDSLATRVGQALSDLAVVYLHVLAPRPWRRHLPPVGDTWRGFAFAPRHRGWDVHPSLGHLEDFARRLGAARPAAAARPGLYYLHVTFPHHPWVMHPSGVAVDEGGLRGLMGRSGEWWRMVEQYRAYQLQLGWLDRRVGEFLDALEASGLWDRAMVVVTADHGMAFLPDRDVRRLTTRNLGEILPVPLFVRYPGQRQGAVDRRPARTVDVLPTIAAVLGRPVGWPVDGRDLRAAPAEEEVLRTAAGDLPWARLRTHRERDRADLRTMVVGDPACPDGIRVGPFGRLAGTPVDAWPAGDPAGLVAALPTGAGPPPPVPPPWAPLRVAGEVARLGPGESEEELSLAIAVGGVVQAVTGTFQDGRGRHFSTVLPAAALPGLAQGLALYAVGGTPEAPTLARLPARRDLSHVLEATPTGLHLRRPGREALAVQAGPRAQLAASADGIEARGEAPAGATVLLLFVGDELVALRAVEAGAFTARLPRVDLAQARLVAAGEAEAWLLSEPR